jgi:hypothetical protein
MNLAGAILLLYLGSRFLDAAHGTVGPPQLFNLVLATIGLVGGLVLLARALLRLGRRSRRLRRRCQRNREARRVLRDAKRRAKAEWHSPPEPTSRTRSFRTAAGARRQSV